MDTATLEPVRTARPRLEPPVRGLTLVAHPDPRRIGERVAFDGAGTGAGLDIGRAGPDFCTARGAPVGPLGDRYVSRRPLSISALPGGRIRVDASGCGSAVCVDGAPLDGALDLDPEALDIGVTLELAGRVGLLLHRFRWPGPEPRPSMGLVGESDAVEALRAEIRQVADLEVPVLLRGESGTGKELVAEAIHRHSRRSDKPWLALNMGAVPPSTAAAELFGHARGAFTGADRARPGLFREAHGGTLFLDEIGEAPAEVQVMLLRALETGEVRGVGEGGGRRVDVRVLAATDADLEGAIEAGRFRAPLLYRLAGYEIRLPPLRDRRDDIARLLVHFLRAALAEAGEPPRADTPSHGETPWLPCELVTRLVRHDWPGNVRQLRNVARQLVISSRGRPTLCTNAAIDAMLDAVDLSAPPSAISAEVGAGEPGDAALVDALRRHRWRIQPTAQALGISRQALYRRIDRSDAIRKAGEVAQSEIEAALVAAGGRVDEAAMRLEVSPRGLRLRMTELGLG